MIITETIPTILTWAEIKEHCRLEDESEKSYLTSAALAAVEHFEQRTNFAAGERTISVEFSEEDLERYGSGLLLPKGPIQTVTAVYPTDEYGAMLDADDYQLRKQGHYWFLHLYVGLTAPATVEYLAGCDTVPSSIKFAVLAEVEEMRVTRGITSAQSRNVNEEGYKRIIDLYDTGKSLGG